MDERNETAPAKTKYKWPWVLLALVLLGILLAVIWVSLEAKRIHEQRDPLRMQQN